MDKEQLEQISKALTNVAAADLGAQALFATDDFFAAKERMLNPAEPVWLEGKYDEHGKWMDGWESRRKRENGHDYCIVRLSAAARIKYCDLDTRFFTGNYPPLASVDACNESEAPNDNSSWTEIIPPSPLQGDEHNLFQCNDTGVWTHLRLNIFPDGGIARFRVYGDIV